MKEYRYCPNCCIGLNYREIQMKFWQNCKHSWIDDDDNENLLV